MKTPDQAIREALAGTLDTSRCVYCGQPADLVCADCEARAEANNAAIAREERDARVASRNLAFESRIPERYRATEIDKLPNPAIAAEILERFDPAGSHGLTLVGPSFTGKSRIAALIAKKAYADLHAFEFEQAGTIRREFVRRSRDGDEDEILKRLIAPRLLILDDFGNTKNTDASDEFFLNLLERRMGVGKPVIITTQYPSAELIERASGVRIGTAIARRIGPDECWVLNTERWTITPPKNR